MAKDNCSHCGGNLYYEAQDNALRCLQCGRSATYIPVAKKSGRGLRNDHDGVSTRGKGVYQGPISRRRL